MTHDPTSPDPDFQIRCQTILNEWIEGGSSFRNALAALTLAYD